MGGSGTPDAAPVIAELDRWADAGLTAGFWLRDDDARSDTPALRELLRQTADAGIAPLIAAIPEGATPDLVERCAAGNARLAVHGFAHCNHAPAGAKKAELGADRPVPHILDELDRARESLLGLAGQRLLPVLVPPWNRIAPEVTAGLARIGFSGLSGFGPKRRLAGVPGLVVANTHLDLIDWHGTRSGRDHAELFADLARVLEAARHDDPDEPIGILTHHLVHDRVAVSFLDALFPLLQTHEASVWLSPGTIWC